MSNYLRESRTMPYEVLTAIAERLHTTTDYLLGVTEMPTKPLGTSAAEQGMLRDFRMRSKEPRREGPFPRLHSSPTREVVETRPWSVTCPVYLTSLLRHATIWKKEGIVPGRGVSPGPTQQA